MSKPALSGSELVTSATPKPRAGEHTKGPWCLGPDGGLWSKDGPLQADADEANARRIVACVNALEGMPTELLETHGANAAAAAEHRTRLLMGDIDALREREKALVEALEWYAEHWNLLPDSGDHASAALKARNGR